MRVGIESCYWRIAILLCALFTTSWAADPGLIFQDGQVSPGQTVSVPVQIESTRSIAALQFDLTADPQNLTTGSPSAGEILSNHTIASASLTASKRRVVLYSLENSSIAEGHMLTIPVQATPQAPDGVYKITVSNVIASDPRGKRIPLLAGDLNILIGSTLELRLDASLLSAADLQLKITGTSGTRCKVESSSDLQNWALVGELTLVDGSASLSDPIAEDGSSRFYRAITIE